MSDALDRLVDHLDRLAHEINAALSSARAMREERDAAAQAEEQEFPEHDLIDTADAAIRFRKPPDTIRHWCESEGIGVKVGGRWKVSASKLRARLGY